MRVLYPKPDVMAPIPLPGVGTLRPYWGGGVSICVETW